MIAQIKAFSLAAQQTISTLLVSHADKYNDNQKSQLNELAYAYQQLDYLIKKAEAQNATLGLALLSLQLNHGTNGNNAIELLKNFTKILHLRHDSPFHIENFATDIVEYNQFGSRVKYESGGIIDFFKFMSVCIMGFIFSGTMMFLSNIPIKLNVAANILFVWSVFSVPLVMTYGFDRAFSNYSMGRMYDEIKKMEEMLAAPILIICLVNLKSIFAAAPIMPVIQSALIISVLLSVGVSLIVHSRTMEQKHVQLCETTTIINRNLSAFGLFKTSKNNHILNEEKIDSDIRAPLQQIMFGQTL